MYEHKPTVDAPRVGGQGFRKRMAILILSFVNIS